MKKLIVALGFLTLLSVAVPFTVMAASLTLWPSQCQPASHTVPLADVNAFARWNFNWLSATDVGGATFEGGAWETGARQERERTTVFGFVAPQRLHTRMPNADGRLTSRTSMLFVTPAMCCLS